jgi:hypothetical protein
MIAHLLNIPALELVPGTRPAAAKEFQIWVELSGSVGQWRAAEAPAILSTQRAASERALKRQSRPNRFLEVTYFGSWRS